MTDQDFTPISKPRVKHAPRSTDELRVLIDLIAEEHGGLPGSNCADDPDEEHTSYSMKDGVPVPGKITFGHIRRAHAALAELDKADRLDAIEAGPVEFDLKGFASRAESIVVSSTDPSGMLVGKAEAERIVAHIRKLHGLVHCLLNNEPSDPIADGGHVVLDLWRHDARQLLGITPVLRDPQL